MTTLDIPHGLHKGRKFLESFGGHINASMLLLMKLPHMLHIEGKFFKSCGCLFLVCRDDIGSKDLIYEMMKGSSMWSVRYVVNIELLMHPLPEGWLIRTSVWSICLGEGEEDAFMLFDIGTNEIDDDDDEFEFIPHFNLDPNLYEFIPSLAKGLNRELKHCKLNIEDNDHPIMTSLDLHHGLHRGRKFLESFGGPCNDPILLLMEIPHMLHLEGIVFKSCRCLLLVYRDDISSTDFTIKEMMKGSLVWLVSICLGEGEEDDFVVINIFGKVVKCNIISNTTTEIFDIGSNQMNDDDDDDDAVEFIPPFEVDPNLYEFIMSLASV
ncbi:hypothetical protein Tco_0909829 [Tanacetum coccineum]|uniref:Uncharacterized protein n=1 Tax=Tanacetum coccineum TaxID=301880 RepID=A0ABQ5CS41_9ASTR